MEEAHLHSCCFFLRLQPHKGQRAKNKTKKKQKTLQWTNKDAQVAAALDMRGGRERMRGRGGGVSVGWSGGGATSGGETEEEVGFSARRGA